LRIPPQKENGVASETLEDSLTGYKEKIVPTTKAVLKWDKDLIFTGVTERGHEIEFDAENEWGCRPTDALLLSLAGCMGIDLVMFLQKMRLSPEGFKLELVGERNETPPQYFKSIEMVVHVKGKSVTPEKLERAIALSREKYCSVYNSLRKDLVLNVRYVLE
jgi:putative redox protein